MKKAEIRPIATPKPLNRSSQKLAGVIMTWTAPGMQTFVANGSGFFPQIRDFAVLLGWLVCSFFWVRHKAPAYTPGRIFTQNTSNYVVPCKEVPFGVSMTIFYIWILKFPKNSHFGDLFWLDFSFFATENRFNMGMLQYKLSLIVIVAP